MKLILFGSVFIIFLCFIGCSARTPQVCYYEPAKQFLQNFQEYIDFEGGDNGACVKRVTCDPNYRPQFEWCKDAILNCEELAIANDKSFPKCCKLHKC